MRPGTYNAPVLAILIPHIQQGLFDLCACLHHPAFVVDIGIIIDTALVLLLMRLLCVLLLLFRLSAIAINFVVYSDTVVLLRLLLLLQQVLLQALGSVVIANNGITRTTWETIAQPTFTCNLTNQNM